MELKVTPAVCAKSASLHCGKKWPHVPRPGIRSFCHLNWLLETQPFKQKAQECASTGDSNTHFLQGAPNGASHRQQTGAHTPHSACEAQVETQQSLVTPDSRSHRSPEPELQLNAPPPSEQTSQVEWSKGSKEKQAGFAISQCPLGLLGFANSCFYSKLGFFFFFFPGKLAMQSAE